MASRSGNSVGMIVSLVVLFVFALGMFATTVIFFAKSQELNKQLASAKSDLNEAVSARDERWQELRTASGSQAVVPWLDELFGTGPLFMIVFVLAGFASGVKVMLQSAKELQRKNQARAAKGGRGSDEAEGARAPQDEGR